MMYYGWLTRTAILMMAHGDDVLLTVNGEDVLWMANQNCDIDDDSRR
jgi:hypothetical protein